MYMKLINVITSHISQVLYVPIWLPTPGVLYEYYDFDLNNFYLFQ